MKKKIMPTNTHKKCFYVIPDMSNLSVETGEPILGTCRYCKYKVLLSEITTCKYYKDGTENN